MGRQRLKIQWDGPGWTDCGSEIGMDDLELMANDGEFCPVDCEHKVEIFPDQFILGFGALYICQKYRSILGIHAARPLQAILGGDPTVMVLKAPFCRRGTAVVFSEEYAENRAGEEAAA